MLELTKNWVIFTDLDGSLLDHDTYQWDDAQRCLNRLLFHQVPIVMTTSKTSAEITSLQQDLGLWEMPAIAENGAHILLPTSWQIGLQSSLSPISLTYPDLCQQLNVLREQYGFPFYGFSDMDDAAVAAVTGLTLQQATLARQRTASEPLLWQGDTASLEMFRKCLAQKKLSLTEGGRFFHVMHKDVSKGAAVNRLIQHIKSNIELMSRRSLATIGLGDGPNDISFLESMDYAVIIKGPSSKKVTLSPFGGREIYYTQAAGPAGWSEGITYFFGRYETGLLD
ncbi:HAD-IIB family hydrolase [Dickeya sp. CFBP 2040]|uniref:HAD-IIB family hydrolase n=1 Tax=Dickeya sp. CFBP 2040 TaxID=2718531 RepID=UPI00144892DF|nr:HAD-IIB family hydrolase [Dickeya sp. CFBP 2040]NKI72848.1 HAD-IIB family hydrolase [Dickeya sp. CFBP 2040]